MVVLDAILSDCEDLERGRARCKWRQPPSSLAARALGTHDPGGPAAFEQALVLKNADAVKVLIQYNVDAGRVRLDSLFVDALDRYHIFDELADSDLQSAQPLDRDGRPRAGARAAVGARPTPRGAAGQATRGDERRVVWCQPRRVVRKRGPESRRNGATRARSRAEAFRSSVISKASSATART